MASGTEIYYKARDIVRRCGHSESESCRIFKDWHIELRVGAGHVSVWTSQGIVYLTMLEKPVYYRPGAWEEHLARLHLGRPIETRAIELRELLRAQALSEEHNAEGEEDGSEREWNDDSGVGGLNPWPSPESRSECPAPENPEP